MKEQFSPGQTDLFHPPEKQLAQEQLVAMSKTAKHLAELHHAYLEKLRSSDYKFAQQTPKNKLHYLEIQEHDYRRLTNLQDSFYRVADQETLRQAQHLLEQLGPMLKKSRLGSNNWRLFVALKRELADLVHRVH